MIVLDSAYPVLSCVLGWAAIGKLGRFREFAGQVAAYRLLPALLVLPAALAVLAGELVTTVLLVPPPTRPFGAALATLLLAVFLAAQASALARGLEINCGCFGGSDELAAIGPATVTRTALLLLLAVGVDAAGSTPFRPIELLLGPLLAGVVGLVPELAQRRYLR
ncbi:MAG TPA: MauE/DoxX family redox-associated membrane protein [Pseudonocardiaceae bacterium]|nr:MauE/DoxX family redox-associated membrane protein [Pseudonocardiaceae bacterium]